MRIVCHLVSHVIFLLNTKHHLDSTTFSTTTLYNEHLFQNLFSRLSHVKSESGRNPRNTSPTGNEPDKLATISGTSLEDIYQFFEVQGEIGEEDQQAPIIEEVKEFGQIGTQSLLDHEMAETSLVEKMSYLQSQIRRWRVSTPEELLGNQMQWSFRLERVSAQTSHSSEGHMVFTKT